MDLIKTCERLCKASYDGGAGFVEVGDLCYGLFLTPHGRILCIRGTKEWENWLRNVRATPWPTGNGYLAHKGFIRAFEDLRQGGMPVDKELVDYVTGHSLGGAIATRYAEETRCGLVTFGSPKVYFRFSPAPRLKHTRIVRDDDPVPWVPGAFYTHRCKAIERKDHDHSLVDVSDHYMKNYITPEVLK